MLEGTGLIQIDQKPLRTGSLQVVAQTCKRCCLRPQILKCYVAKKYEMREPRSGIVLTLTELLAFNPPGTQRATRSKQWKRKGGTKERQATSGIDLSKLLQMQPHSASDVSPLRSMVLEQIQKALATPGRLCSTMYPMHKEFKTCSLSIGPSS